MQTPIDFGKDFLNRYFDQKDADTCLQMLAGDLVWITPEDMHHFLSEGAVLKFLQESFADDSESRYVDLISIKSSPSADNIMTVAYEINLVSRDDERPLYLRCSMAICRRNRRLEITFLHFSRKAPRDSSEQLRGFISNLPCGVMILACLEGQREEVIFYNDYFANRLRYKEAEFARSMAQNPFFMTSEEDRERIREQIGQARSSGGNIAANLRFFRKDGNSFYYRMLGAPAYQADGGTVYYCVFQEITGFRMANERLQNRLDVAKGILRQVPGAICGIEYPPAEEASGGTREPSGKKPAGRVFFTSKNIPAMFGVSNSVYMKGILEDPFFGLEVTSITRRKLMELPVFSGLKAVSAGPVSCGIFRLKRDAGTAARLMDSLAQAGIRSAEEAAAVSPAEAGAGTEEAPAADPGSGTMTDAGLQAGGHAAASRRTGQEPETPRVELMVRRVREKSGRVRLYLFYFDCEARQKEMERRVDRAMKMGRAGQDQLRADLRKAKESAARRQTEMDAAMQAAQEKHDIEITRAENRLLEEKNRAVLLARQLEESRAAQKQMAEDLEKTQEDASRRIRSSRSGAEQKVREAAAARDLLEEQLREAQERNRVLERQLQNERTRRVLLEEQLREGGQSVSEMLEEAGEPGSGTLSGRSGSETTGSRAQSAAQPRREGTFTAEEDWMTAAESLTVFSSMDPVPSSGAAPMMMSAPTSTGGAGTAGAVRFAGAPVIMKPTAAPAGAQETVPNERSAPAAAAAAPVVPDDELSAEERAFLAEKRIRAREQEKAQRRLRRVMERESGKGEEFSSMMDDFLESASSGQVLLEERPFSPAECLENVLRYEDLACTEKEITLRYYKDSRLPASVTGFGALLRRALCELLENAIAATPRGGLISVHCRADRPSEGLVNLYFRIDDNGKGITPDRMQTIFEAERESGTDAPVHSGLFAVKEAAVLMGGSIHARSGPGGSRFMLNVTVRTD